MKKNIDWRENLAFLFLPYSYPEEEPLIPTERNIRWTLLSYVLPHEFYHFFPAGKKTPLEAIEIASEEKPCSLQDSKIGSENMCEYYKSHQNSWRPNMGYKCRRCCACAQYKLLQPSNTKEISRDHIGQEYHLLKDCNDLAVYTKGNISDNPFEVDILQWSDHIGRQVTRLFESKAERAKDYRKKEDGENDIKNFGFYQRVCQFIQDSIIDLYEDPKLYRIKPSLLNQIQGSLLGSEVTVTEFSENGNFPKYAYTLNFPKWREILEKGSERTNKDYHRSLLKYCFKKKRNQNKSRKVFLKEDYLYYLNQADKKLKTRWDSDTHTDDQAKTQNSERKNETNETSFKERFNFLISLLIGQFFLNKDYIQNYFINPGSAAQYDEDLYEEKKPV